MSQLAAANRSLIADTFLTPGDDEYEVAKRFAAAAEVFAPLTAESLAYVLNLHLLEQIRHDAIGAADVSEGRLASAAGRSVALRRHGRLHQLGETLAPDELGTVTGRLAELAAEVVEPPVRLVKLIGDAAMMVGPEPGRCSRRRSTSSRRRGRGRGASRCCGPALPRGSALRRGGDWYGRPVNIASRVTAIARPGSVLADRGPAGALADAYEWSFAGARRLKGIDGAVKLYRCRRADA